MSTSGKPVNLPDWWKSILIRDCDTYGCGEVLWFGSLDYECKTERVKKREYAILVTALHTYVCNKRRGGIIRKLPHTELRAIALTIDDRGINYSGRMTYSDGFGDESVHSFEGPAAIVAFIRVLRSCAEQIFLADDMVQLMMSVDLLAKTDPSDENKKAKDDAPPLPPRSVATTTGAEEDKDDDQSSLPEPQPAAQAAAATASDDEKTKDGKYDATVEERIIAKYKAYCAEKHMFPSTDVGYFISSLISSGSTRLSIAEIPGAHGIEDQAEGTPTVSLELGALLRSVRGLNTFTDVDVDGKCGVYGSDVIAAAGELLRNDKIITRMALRDLKPVNKRPQSLRGFLRVFAKSAVNQLSFAGSTLEPESFCDFCNTLPKLARPLYSLDLTNCHMASETTLALLEALTHAAVVSSSLEHLWLSGNELSGYCQVTLCKWLKEYLGNSPLKTLGLAKTGIELTYCAPYFQFAVKLERLDVSSNAVSDDAWLGLEALLRSLDSLKFLGIADTGISPGMVTRLLRTIAANEKITEISIDLSHNYLGNRRRAAGVNALLDGFQCFGKMDELNLANNDFTPDEISTLLAVLCSTAETPKTTDEVVKTTTTTTSSPSDLTTTTVTVTTTVTTTTTTTTSLASAQDVKGDGPHILILNGNHVVGNKASSAANCAAGFAKLIACRPRISALGLSVRDSDAAGVFLHPFIKAVANTNSLTFLDICGHGIGDYGIALLAHSLVSNTSLLELHYDGNKVTYNGWSQLAFSLQRNHHILFVNFPRCDFVSYVSGVSCIPELAMFVQKAASALEEIRCICLRNQKRLNHGDKDDGGNEDDGIDELSPSSARRFKNAARIAFNDLELREAVLELPDILEKTDEAESKESQMKQFRASRRFSFLPF